MAQGNIIKKSALKSGKKAHHKQKAKTKRENRKGAVQRSSKGHKSVRNKYAGEGSGARRRARGIDEKKDLKLRPAGRYESLSCL